MEVLLSKIFRMGKFAEGIDALLERSRSDPDDALYSFLWEKLCRFGGSSTGNWKDQSPILAFLSGLLLEAKGNVFAAREAMQRGLRPVITVEASQTDNVDDIFKNMLAAGKIDLRCIPAIADSYPKIVIDI